MARRTTPGIERLSLDSFEEPPLIAVLAEGRLGAVTNATAGEAAAVFARTSRDGGRTWDERRELLRLPRGSGGWVCAEAFADREGRVHLFLLNDARTGVIDQGEVERPSTGERLELRLDIWHSVCASDLSPASDPACIWKGYTGALNSVVQLSNGRILLPFSFQTGRNWRKRGGGIWEYGFCGPYDATVLASDDGGRGWRQSESLRIPVPDITYAYGACEPVAVELASGRVWMLIRGQTGRFYESFSKDGLSWSSPKPSALVSSDSPAGLVRLADGRIVLLWNACLRFPYAYGGRHVLHAAISEDDGSSWIGFREVARDPKRGEPPPPSGDFGTAYPYPVATPDGSLLFRSGQGTARAIVARLHPGYLYETAQRAEFPRDAEDWSWFGTRGVEIAERSPPETASALALRRVDREFPAAAVWNFPLGAKGRLRLEVLLEAGSGGLRVGLTDHFSVPFDEEDVFHNVLNARLAVPGEPGDEDDVRAVRLLAGAWHLVEIRWDCAAMRARLSVDGARASGLPLQRIAEGICYLRLRAAAEVSEAGRALLRRAVVTLTPPSPRRRLQAIAGSGSP